MTQTRDALTWTEFHVFSDAEGGKAQVLFSTNDDNDDGWPDGEVATATLWFDSVEQALRHTGMTRRGFYGQPVNVYLDGRPYRKE